MGSVTSGLKTIAGYTPAGALMQAATGTPISTTGIAKLAEKTPLGQLVSKASKSGLAGGAGGASGTGFSGPKTVPLTSGVTNGDVANSNAGAVNSLASQQSLLAALQAQQGMTNQNTAISNQSQLATQTGQQGGLANQTDAMNQQQALNNQFAGAGGVQNLSGALQSQQALAAQQQATAAQYQNIANGTGPNPAQAALNQSTGQNVAAQAALMAGQRGAGSNVGLLARQAAQQGAATQQQAVGQGATMQAQQQIAGLAGLAGQQQAIGATQQNVAGIAGQQIGQQQAGTIAQQQAAAQQVAQQQAAANAYAGQANTLAGQQIGATTANTQAQQSEQGIQQKALSDYNQQQVGMQGNVNSANAGLANTTMQGQQGIIGGLMNGAGAAVGKMAEGGEVSKKFADGGATEAPVAPVQPLTVDGPQSSFGQFLKNWTGGDKAENQAQVAPVQMPTSNTGSAALQKGASGATSGAMSALGGMAKGGMAKSGGDVKAKDEKQKAVKSGNSYDNDKIPAVLSEGEVVIPRSVMQSKDPARASAEFVAKVLAKRRK